MKVLIAAAGSGGHINPGIAIAKEIMRRNPYSEIRFVGTKKGMENELVPRQGFVLETIDVKGFRRKLSMDTLKTIQQMFRSFFQAATLLKEFNPDIVIGTGGYVCGPVLIQARLKKIPTLLHESNALPGITTRILSRWMNVVAINFEDTRKRLSPKSKVVLTGNPIRQEILEIKRDDARERLNIRSDEKVVCVFFGSQGSATLNQHIVEMITKHEEGLGFRLIFSTGIKYYDQVVEQLKGGIHSEVEVVPYIFNVDQVLASSDLALCRAGAMTLGELCALGVPSILIPSPYVADNHQEFNARSIEASSAAVVILEKQLTADILFEQIKMLVNDPEHLRQLSANAKKIRVENATAEIVDLVEYLIRK
jgi:UDP-N-acetylglucosamine--N-acetylmuramyl-(pentapeptide) pyrophosphoryl-undecaprenol N-acetylglucosamine transferase